MPALLDFRPLIKQIRWGGTRLGTLLGKPIGRATDAAESWELVDHGADQTVVASGPWAGLTLAEVVEQHGADLLGRHAGLTQFPLLVKYLDANDRLSVQVHPDDARAKTYDPNENGKTEAWVILAVEPGARLYAGLHANVDRPQLERALAQGKLADCLHSFDVTPGDCVFIPAGTVHAIAEGVLLAEIQQSSDLTFRLDDWGRVGADGKPRPLHIRQSLDCTDYARGPIAPVVPQPLDPGEFAVPGASQLAGTRHEELVRCGHFVIRRHTGDAPFALPDDNRFHVLLGLAGSADVTSGNERRPLRFGQTLLATAHRPPLHIEPHERTIVLDAFLP